MLPQQGNLHLAYKESIIAVILSDSIVGKSVWTGRGVRVEAKVAVGFLVGGAVAVRAKTGVEEACGEEAVPTGFVSSVGAERHPSGPMKVTLEMWRVTGDQTGAAYVRKIDRKLPIAPQIASSICWSSECMGEDATMERGANEREAFVVHRACPWQRWHERNDLVKEDRPGCDEWFRATIATVNEALGTNVKFETIEALPDGGATCRRRIWE